MIPLWKRKNPIYFGVINTIIPFDNLYRQAYFVMHTFLVLVSCPKGQLKKVNVEACRHKNIARFYTS
jgi:hypothetical protein